MGDVDHTDGDTLSKLYHDKGLDQHEIAELAGVTRSTVSYWMSKHSIETRTGTKDVKQRIEERHEKDPETGCWEWKAGMDNGYGRICVDSETTGAHRASYMAYKGEIPDDLCVCHACHNRSCVNPDHLYAGTHTDNMADAIEDGSIPHNGSLKTGEKNRNSKLTREDVKKIKRLLGRGYSQSEIADGFGVHQTNITAIDNGRTWSHVDLG